MKKRSKSLLQRRCIAIRSNKASLMAFGSGKPPICGRSLFKFMRINHTNRLADILKRMTKANKLQKEPLTKATQLWLPGFDPDEPVEFSGLFADKPHNQEGSGQ